MSELIDIGHGEQLPHFASEPTVVADWRQWRQPGPDDRVLIPEGVSWLLQDEAQAASVVVAKSARLVLRAGATLRVGTLQVLPGGELEVYAQEPGERVDIIFDDALHDAADDPQEYGLGLIGLGKVIMRGMPKTTYLQLAELPRAGATTLRLIAEPGRWQPGDVVLLPPVSRSLYFNPQLSERLVIEAVRGREVALRSPLVYDHHDGWERPHLVSLSRSIRPTQASCRRR